MPVIFFHTLSFSFSFACFRWQFRYYSFADICHATSAGWRIFRDYFRPPFQRFRQMPLFSFRHSAAEAAAFSRDATPAGHVTSRHVRFSAASRQPPAERLRPCFQPSPRHASDAADYASQPPAPSFGHGRAATRLITPVIDAYIDIDITPLRQILRAIAAARQPRQ